MGEKRHPVMASRGRDVPDPHRAVLARRHQPTVVRGELHAADRCAMPGQDEELLSTPGVPDTCGAVRAPSRDELAVRAAGRAGADGQLAQAGHRPRGGPVDVRRTASRRTPPLDRRESGPRAARTGARPGGRRRVHGRGARAFRAGRIRASCRGPGPERGPAERALRSTRWRRCGATR